MNSIEDELNEANARLPVVIEHPMPLETSIRSMALAIAQRHCGDTTVRDGNLYMQLRAEGKLTGPLTVNHVIETALIFEMYLIGKWSEGIIDAAVDQVLKNARKGLAAKSDELAQAEEFWKNTGATPDPSDEGEA
jgi:hypothetical protein